MKKFVAIFPNGERVERRSDAAYVAASRDASGRVRFHREVPVSRPGRVVVPVGAAAAKRACVVCADEPVPGVIHERRADGSVVASPCYRCGR